MTPEATIQVMWLVWMASWLAAAAWSDRALKRRSAGRRPGYRLLAFLGAVLLFGISVQSAWGRVMLWRPSTPLKWVLVAIAFAGLVFTWWARIHLGRLWSGHVTIKANHRVVDSGPYAIVRHPIYTGLILAAIATAAIRSTAPSWFGACVIISAFVIKARIEEEFLSQELGAEAYGQYARRVPMLVPLAAPRR